MARPSTLPTPWLDLANAVGGIETLCTCLSWSYMALYRRARGLVGIPKADRMLIEQLAKQHHVTSPLIVDNLGPLEMLGDAISLGFPPSREETARVLALYTTEELTKVAETDGVSSNVLRAVGHLLGL